MYGDSNSNNASRWPPRNSSLSGGVGNPPEIWSGVPSQPLSAAAAEIDQTGRLSSTPLHQQFENPNNIETYQYQCQYPGQFSAMQTVIPPLPHPRPRGHHRTLSSETAGQAMEVTVLAEVPEIFDFHTTPALAQQTLTGTSNLSSTQFALASVAAPRFSDSQYPPGFDVNFTPGTSRAFGYTASQPKLPNQQAAGTGTGDQPGDLYASLGMVPGEPTNPVTSTLYGRPGTYIPTPSNDTPSNDDKGEEASEDDPAMEELMKMVLDPKLVLDPSVPKTFIPPSIRLPPVYYPAVGCELMTEYATAFHGNFAIGLILGFFGKTNGMGLGLLTLDRPDEGLNEIITNTKDNLKHILLHPPENQHEVAPPEQFIDYYTANLFQSLIEKYVIPPMASAYDNMYSNPLLEGVFTFAIEKVLKNPDLLPFANFDVPTEGIMFSNAARLVATHTLDIHQFSCVPASTVRTPGKTGRSPLNTRINFMNPSSSANIAEAMDIARLFGQRRRLLDAKLPLGTEKSPMAWKTEEGVLVMRFSDDTADRNDVYILHFQSPCVIAITRWLIGHINGDFPETVAAFIEDQVAIGKTRFPTRKSNAAHTTQPHVNPRDDGDLVWHVAKTAVAVIGAALYMADKKCHLNFTAKDILDDTAAMDIFRTRLLSAETALWKLKTEHDGEYRILRANILEMMITATQSLAPGFIQDLNFVCRPEDSIHLSPGPESHHQGRRLNSRFVPFAGFEKVIDRDRARLQMNQHELARTVLRDTIPYSWAQIGKPKAFYSHPGFSGREVVSIDPNLEDDAQRDLAETQRYLARA
ncbi:hypothetical protein DFP72DRAFT_857042 [Ephemerocybe angulata]|uniref:Uncharacterized protein n=1 Tax=Ephemerocybe angulata TaxID=980116 RepID=A0A8H6HDH0_9AGAR|nr:hypothetical protein DFP72DRAFT_857042 [Tulosesus angulatus]